MYESDLTHKLNMVLRELSDVMKAITADALEAKKKEIARDWMQPETQEEPNETDHGTD